MNRGISTVLDVSVAVLLVGASIGVLSGIPVGEPTPVGDSSSGGGAAIAGSTMTVDYETAGGQPATVTGTTAGLLRDAAIAQYRGADGTYVDAVRSAVADRIERTGARTQLVASCSTGEDIVAGGTPPGGKSVRATVYDWNRGTESADCRPVVVVRSWSA